MTKRLSRLSVSAKEARVSASAARGKKRALRRILKTDTQLRGKQIPYMQEELTQVGESFRFLAEALPEIIWTAEPDGTVDFMNSRWFDYTGLTPKETYLEQKSAVHPDDLLEYKRRWKEAIDTQQPYETEYRFRRASDGMYRWFLGRGSPVCDEKGNILKWFGTCTDIHARKVAEEEVRKLNEQLELKVSERTRDLEREIEERMEIEEQDRAKLNLLRTIIDTMPMAAVATDNAHTILHANDLFRSLFVRDSSRDLLLGNDCLRLLYDSAANFNQESEYLQMIERLRSFPAEPLSKELTAKDGHIYLLDYLPISEGTYQRGHLLLCRDITQEKRINRAKTEFMSLASHQLRTPLTSIRWGLNRLAKQLQTTLKPEERSLLEKARLSVSNMASTISTMLSISRIEAGMLSLKKEDLQLCSFLSDVAKSFKDLSERKNQMLTVECHTEAYLHTDPHLLREVIENLLSNAIKYTPQGGQISISVTQEKEKAAISVSDTGYGIPKAQQSKVFSKFFRGENVVQIDTEGTGLGLYLVSQIVELLGGKISFRSEVNKGTTFTLLI